jgi:hypothetical protein
MSFESILQFSANASIWSDLFTNYIMGTFFPPRYGKPFVEKVEDKPVSALFITGYSCYVYILKDVF